MRETNNSPSTVTLGAATETEILSNNALRDRARVVITNGTGADLRVRKGRGAAAGVGILLVSDGVLVDEPVTVAIKGRLESFMYQGPWYGYSVAGGDVDLDEERLLI